MWNGMGNVCGSVCWFYMRNCIQSERDLLTKLDTTWNEQDMKRNPPQLRQYKIIKQKFTSLSYFAFCNNYIYIWVCPGHPYL